MRLAVGMAYGALGIWWTAPLNNVLDGCGIGLIMVTASKKWYYNESHAQRTQSGVMADFGSSTMDIELWALNANYFAM